MKLFSISSCYLHAIHSPIHHEWDCNDTISSADSSDLLLILDSQIYETIVDV